MSKLTLSCPHCGYSKDVERDKFPHDEVRLKCPSCAKSFVFNVKEAEQAAAAPGPVDEAGHEDKIRAVCPSCGFFRKISAELIPPEGKRIKCPRCKETFTVGGPEEEVSEEAPTVPAGALPEVSREPEVSTEGAAPPPDIPETDYQTHGLGDLSGHIGKPITGELKEQEYAEAELPSERDEDNLFEGEPAVPVSDEGPGPDTEYTPDYGETRVGELSGHIDEPILPEEEKAGGYQTELPEDLSSAGVPETEEEIEIISKSEPDSVTAETEETKPVTAYGKATPERPRAEEGHGFAVRTDFEELLKEQPAARRAPMPGAPGAEMPGEGGEEFETGDLMSVSELLSETWSLFRTRSSTFIRLMLLCPLFVAAALGVSYGTGYLFALLTPEKAFDIQFSGKVLGAFITAYLLSWWAAAVIKASSNNNLTAGDSLQMTKPLAGAFLWLAVIASFVVTGGSFLFVVPGVIMSVWFALSWPILVRENVRGLDAMIKSREYVRGHWGEVFWRLAVVWLLPTAVVAIERLALVLYLLYLPFAVAYTYMIYKDLRQIKGPVKAKTGKDAYYLYVAVGAVGVLAPAAILASMLYSGMKHTHDSRSLIAMLTGEDEDVVEAYTGYREALLDGDSEAVTDSFTPDYADRLRYKSGDVVGYLKGSSPPGDVEVTSVDFDNFNATLSLESDRDGGVVIGKALLVKRLGSWYIDSEDWSLSTRPRPVRLEGGEPAPGFEPLDLDLITPGPSFGGKTAPFYEPGRKFMKFNTLVGHQGRVSSLVFMKDSRYLVSLCDTDRTVKVWNVAEAKSLDTVSLANTPISMDVTSDGSMLVLSDTFENLVFIPLSNGSLGRPEMLRAGIGRQSSLAISPNGLLIATASLDGKVTLWDLHKRTRLATISMRLQLKDIVFSPAGDVLAVCSPTNKLTLFSLENGTGMTYTIPNTQETSGVAGIDISSDGKYLISGHMDSSVSVWDLQSQKGLLNFSTGSSPTRDVEFCPDGSCFATAQQDSDIYIWDRATASRLTTLGGHAGAALSLAFSPDGRILASGGAGGNIIVWGPQTGGE